LAYFASGVVVAGATVLVLYQIHVAKQTLSALHQQLTIATAALTVARDDIRIRSQREAVVLAAELCEKFAAQIIPRVTANIRHITDLKIQLRAWELSDASFDEPAYVQRPEVRSWLASTQNPPAAIEHILAVLNDLEAFAIYFTRGAADEAVAYPVVGAIFCAWVENFAPHLIAARTKMVKGLTSGPYQNIVELYKMWSVRTRRKELELKANRINLELSGLPSSDLRPIGTN
jgi:hypothetical protein